MGGINHEGSFWEPNGMKHIENHEAITFVKLKVCLWFKRKSILHTMVSYFTFLLEYKPPVIYFWPLESVYRMWKVICLLLVEGFHDRPRLRRFVLYRSPYEQAWAPDWMLQDELQANSRIWVGHICDIFRELTASSPCDFCSLWKFSESRKASSHVHIESATFWWRQANYSTWFSRQAHKKPSGFSS